MAQWGGGQTGDGQLAGGAKREQRRTFSTDCPLTNMSRLALCIHVECTLINSTVDNGSGPALSFPAERVWSDVCDGVEFKQLDEGPVRGKRCFVGGRGVGAVGELLSPGSVGITPLPSGRRAERSSPPPPGRGNGEAVGGGAETGVGGACHLWAQEVEAEAVVVPEPRSVLLPSVVRKRKRSFK